MVGLFQAAKYAVLYSVKEYLLLLLDAKKSLKLLPVIYPWRDRGIYHHV